MNNNERAGDPSRTAEPQVSFEQLKARVSLERVLRDLLHWQPAKSEGDELRGECPICQAKAGQGKKSRAFAANTAKNRFYCHSCHKNGSIIDLVMLTSNISAREAGLAIAQMLDQPTEALPVQKAIIEVPITKAAHLLEQESSGVPLIHLDLLEIRRPQDGEYTIEPLEAVELVLLARVHPDLLRLLPHLTLPDKEKNQP